MGRTVRQQEGKVYQLHQTIDMMARMRIVHVLHNEVQWLGMKECLDDRKTKWDDPERGNVLWGGRHQGHNREGAAQSDSGQSSTHPGREKGRPIQVCKGGTMKA